MTTYVFPGQGSQFCGMGHGLFNEFPELVEKANRILGYSIETLCLEDPNQTLNKTEFTQPALYIVNALSYLKKINEIESKPDYVAGHSLGEYNALYAANVFDFETGLRCVQKRGQLMSQASGGGMAAIIGLDVNTIKEILEKNNIKNLYIANYNSYTQVVVSGEMESIKTAENYFKEAGAKLFLPLKVSAAFHSPYMNDAKNEFSHFLKSQIFSNPTIPVISNVTAKPYSSNDVAWLLSEQITGSVWWTQSVEYLLDQGETHFVEIWTRKSIGRVNYANTKEAISFMQLIDI